ncbi:SAM-dependent methyltransferase [Sciscionella marina]|uniref:SAM-dependent methyltransferase n=1 Tax=Sciscionella marina TaxID=508770 RepID=UPI0003A721E9|nr:SAM-dependent methyltransferase [Sciscionella marina]
MKPVGGIDDEWAELDVDLDRPNAARVYDYYLGGAYNFAVDREFAQQAEQLLPDVKYVATLNRRFLRRVVRELSALGVHQYLDLGSGIPTVGNVHEIAQETDPEARVVYVDNEAVAVMHSKRILADNPNADIVAGDFRKPAAVLEDPVTTRLLNFDEPIALIMCTILHFISDEDDPRAILGRYRDALCPGSYMAISHGTTDNRPDLQAFGDSYRKTANPVTLRSKTAIEPFFDGFELIEPGLVFTPQWRPDETETDTEPEKSGVYAGVGRKP